MSVASIPERQGNCESSLMDFIKVPTAPCPNCGTEVRLPTPGLIDFDRCDNCPEELDDGERHADLPDG